MAHRQDYIARMELIKKNRIDAGLVSERFPKVSSIIINMTYYQKVANPVLMERIINILPASYAYFNMECMIKDCLNGGFDLTPAISDLIKNRKKSGKGKLVCKGKTNPASTEHASVSYEISIQYIKKSR
ncbi:MAG: hypothetical protein Q7T83_02675 [Thermodesulfovibrionales bacterium]|nr:hypothetical protein [Thermodesulfovibrionales bacterium]MDP3112327.1 hypothetical protein [Thermodesulfovibrionales bacterium]